MKYFPITVPSAEITSEARLDFGFSNSSKVGKSPRKLFEMASTKANRQAIGNNTTSHIIKYGHRDFLFLFFFFGFKLPCFKAR